MDKLKIQAEAFQLRLENMNLRVNLMETVWEYLPCHSQELSNIPPVNLNLDETKSNVSDYIFVDVCGEGQHSTVRKCTQSTSNKYFAIKAIKKKDLLFVANVAKVDTEIKALKMLSKPGNIHENLIQFHECLHGKNDFYIITEFVSQDLVCIIFSNFYYIF